MVSIKFIVVLALIAAAATVVDATTITRVSSRKANCGIGKDGFLLGLGNVFKGLGGVLNFVGSLLGNLLQPRKPTGFASSIDLTVDLSLGVGRVLDRTLIGGLGKLLAKIYIAITKITVCILGPANCKVCQGTYHGIGPVRVGANISVFLKTYGLLNLRVKLQALIDGRSGRKGISYFSPAQQVILNASLKLADLLSVNIGKQGLTPALIQLSIIAGGIGATRNRKDGINIAGGLVDTCNAHLEEQNYIYITEGNYEIITTSIDRCTNDKGAFEKVTETESSGDDNTDQGDNTNQDNNDQADKERADQERADKERADKERADKERADKERADKERADKEKADKERADKERADKERADKEKAAKDKAAKDKAAKDKAAKDKADKERADKERADKERADKEKADKERADREKADKERADKERADKERADKEKAAKDKAAKDKAAKDKADKERADKERADKERADKERADKERADKERADKERADQERADKERADQERADKERADKERADKEKADKEKADQEQGGQSGDNQSGDDQSGDNQSGDNQSGDYQSGDDQSGDYEQEGGVTTGGGVQIKVGLGLGGLGNAVRKVFGVLKGATNLVGSVIDTLLNFKNPRNFDDSAVVSVQLFQGFGSLLDVSFIQGLGSLVVRIFVLISKISICLLGKVDCSLCNANYAGIGRISGDITTVIRNAGLSNCNQDIKALINKKSNGKGITSFTVAEQIVLNNILDLSLLLNAKITKQTFPIALRIGITIFGTIGNTYSVQDNKTGDYITSGLVDACGRYLSNQGFNTITQAQADVIVTTVVRAKTDTNAAWCVKN